MSKTRNRFHGRILKRLQNEDGKRRFLFEHASGTLLQVVLASGKPLPRQSDNLVITGELKGAGVLRAEEIERERGRAFFALQPSKRTCKPLGQK